jgi:hypothetical protein
MLPTSKTITSGGPPAWNVRLSFFFATPAIAWLWFVGAITRTNTTVAVSHRNVAPPHERLEAAQDYIFKLEGVVFALDADFRVFGTRDVEDDAGGVLAGMGLVAPQGVCAITSLARIIRNTRRENGMEPHPYDSNIEGES